MNKIRNAYYELTKGMATGILFMLFACCFWLYLAGNPFAELALIRSAQSISGFIIDAWEQPLDTDEGRTRRANGAIYKYYIDEHEFTKKTKDSDGRLHKEFGKLKQPFRVEVEYLPNNPQVSRIKGDGCQTITEWLWRRVALGGTLLLAFLAIGLFVIQNAINEYRCTIIGFEIEKERQMFEDLMETQAFEELTVAQLREKIEEVEQEREKLDRIKCLSGKQIAPGADLHYILIMLNKRIQTLNQK